MLSGGGQMVTHTGDSEETFGFTRKIIYICRTFITMSPLFTMITRHIGQSIGFTGGTSQSIITHDRR